MSIWSRRNHSRGYVVKDNTSTYTVKMYQMKPNVCSFHVESNNFKFLISSTRPLHAWNDRVRWNTAYKIPFLPLFLSKRCFTFEKNRRKPCKIVPPLHLHYFFFMLYKWWIIVWMWKKISLLNRFYSKFTLSKLKYFFLQFIKSTFISLNKLFSPLSNNLFTLLFIQSNHWKEDCDMHRLILCLKCIFV